MSRSFKKEISDIDRKLQGRVLEALAEITYEEVRQYVKAQPEMARLKVAVVRLKHEQKKPSATALATLLGISRRALYRKFSAATIREELKSIRSDGIAVHENSEFSRRGRKKRKYVPGEQDDL